MSNRIHIWTLSILSIFIGGPLLAQIKPAPQFAEDDIISDAVFVDTPTDQVLEFLEMITGRIILRPQGLTNMNFNFNSRGPLTRAEAIKAIESVLSMNSLSIIPLDDKFLRAVPISTPVNALTPEFASDGLPDTLNTQKLYAKIFEIKYLKLETALEIVTKFLTPSLAEPVIFQQSNKILLTDSLNNLKRVEEVLADADTPAQQREEIFFIQLKNTQSRELKQRIDNLIQRSLQSFLVGDTTIESDERTNQMILITHPANEETLRKLIEKMDINVSPLTTTEVFRVNHAKAEELSPLLESVISNQRQARERAERESRNQQRQGNRNQQQPNTPNPEAPQVPGQPEVQTPSNSGGGDSGSKNVQFSEYVGVVPDPRTNSIIAYGTPSDITQLENLLKSLDVLLPQVLIEVIVAEVTLNENDTRGIDALGLDIDFADGVWALSDVAANGFGVDVSEGNIAYSTDEAAIADFNLDLVIGAASGNGSVKVLNAPQILTTHARPATITVGQQRPVITSSQTDSTGTSTRSQVTFRKIGIELTVTPLIGADGKIQLELTQTVDNVVDNVTIDGNSQPVIGNRVAESFVSVNDGDVIILGGLQEYATRNTSSKMGIFGNIPVIGDALFTRKRDEDERRELMIFVRPKILNNTQETADFTEETLTTTPRIGHEVSTFLESGLNEPNSDEKKSESDDEDSRFYNPRARKAN